MVPCKLINCVFICVYIYIHVGGCISKNNNPIDCLPDRACINKKYTFNGIKKLFHCPSQWVLIPLCEISYKKTRF